MSLTNEVRKALNDRFSSMDSMVAYLEDHGFEVEKDYLSEARTYRFTIEKDGRREVGYFNYPEKEGIRGKSEIMKKFCDGLIYDFEHLWTVNWPKENPYIKKNNSPFEITNVIFNDPATIVFWTDGTKTVVKTQNGEIFDPEKGLAMAIAKKAFGNKGNYFNHIGKWVDKYQFEKLLESIPTIEEMCSAAEALAEGLRNLP